MSWFDDYEGNPVLKRYSSKEESLAEEHWRYIEALLEAHGETGETINKVGFHYRTAFVHGWKHAKEDEKEQPK